MIGTAKVYTEISQHMAYLLQGGVNRGRSGGTAELYHPVCGIAHGLQEGLLRPALARQLSQRADDLLTA